MTRLRPDTLRYFFIGGAHKSGTTWIMRMVNTHPAVGIVGEAGFVGFEHSVAGWFNEEAFRSWSEGGSRREQWLWQQDVDDMVRLLKRRLVETVMTTRPWPETIQVLGDKTPYFYNTHIEDLIDLFPDMLFIDVIRDGRDVVTSHMFHMLKLGYGHGAPGRFGEEARRYHLTGEGETHDLFRGEALPSLISNWKLSVEGGQRAAQRLGNAYCALRYEDALREPHREVRRLLEHLQVPVTDEVVESCVQSHTFRKATGGRDPGKADPGSFFRKGVAGDWRNHFTAADRQLFHRQAGALLVQLGYEEDDSWVDPEPSGPDNPASS